MDDNKMKKIGIITYNRSNNYGARLQAYAMCDIFVRRGYEVILFDLDYPQRYFKYVIGRILNIGCGPIERIQKYIITIKMNSFNRNKLKRSKHLVTRSTEKMVAYINSLHLDMIICGSDEIWSSRTKEIAPPSVYFLPDCIKCKRVAFSPSVNGNHIFSESEKKWIKDTLKGYDLIAVRDIMTQNWLAEEIGVNNVKLTVDPTLLIDFENVKLPLCLRKQRVKKRICFVLAKPYGKLVDEIIQRLGKDAYEYYSVFSKNKGTHFLTLSPEQFTCVGEKLNLVITNLFHGVIFAVKNNCQVIAVDTFEKYMDRKSKVQDLTERLGIKKSFISCILNNKAYDDIEILCKRYLSADYKQTVSLEFWNERDNTLRFIDNIEALMDEKS